MPDQPSIVHRAPTGCASSVPCCGEEVFDLPRTDRMTADGEVTCRQTATDPLTDEQLAVLVTRLTYRPTLQGPESNPWLTLHNTVGDQERERFVAAAFTDVPVLLAEVTRLRAELAQARGKVRAVSQVRCWTNEDGKQFVFADDLLAAIQATPACTCRAEPVHQAGCETAS